MARRLVKPIQRWVRTGLIVSLLLIIVLFARESSRRASTVVITDLTPLSLDGYHRILVLAPHCDDETLGSAGLMLAAQRAGIEVRVVIATNGDGFLFATMEDFHKVYPHARDFIHMGKLRQQESLAALKLLGVQEDHVTFLSYPDRGTPSLWNEYWTIDHPYRSPYNGDTQSPYPITYNSKSVYAGVDLLADITSIFASYRPDLVIYPHPDDVHPDHWGLSVFTRLAAALLNYEDSSYQPTQYTYLVHRPDFPTVKGLRPAESLLPPSPLYDLYPNWYRWDLSQEDVALKGQAVNKYRSQLPLLRGLLDSFIRGNELFAPVKSFTLPYLGGGKIQSPESWRDENGQAIQPVQWDPVGDFIVRSAIPAADLKALYAVRDANDTLVTCAQVRGEVEASLIYSLRILAVGTQDVVRYQAQTRNKKPGWHPAALSGDLVCSQVSLSELGNPWIIFLGADVEEIGVGILDQVAWQSIYLEPNKRMARQP